MAALVCFDEGTDAAPPSNAMMHWRPAGRESLSGAPRYRIGVNAPIRALGQTSSRQRPADLAPDMPLKHRLPRHKAEFARALDQRVTPTKGVDGLAIDARDPLAVTMLDKVEPQLVGELPSDAQQLAPAQLLERAAPQDDILPLPVGKPLLDQPLLALPQRGGDIAAIAVTDERTALLATSLRSSQVGASAASCRSIPTGDSVSMITGLRSA